MFLYACGKAEPFKMASAFTLAIFSGNIIFMFVFRNTFSREGAGEETSMFLLFCNFLKFMLDKQAVFRYNKARSGGKHRTKLERSWPGSSVG